MSAVFPSSAPQPPRMCVSHVPPSLPLPCPPTHPLRSLYTPCLHKQESPKRESPSSGERAGTFTSKRWPMMSKRGLLLRLLRRLLRLLRPCTQSWTASTRTARPTASATAGTRPPAPGRPWYVPCPSALIEAARSSRRRAHRGEQTQAEAQAARAAAAAAAAAAVTEEPAFGEWEEEEGDEEEDEVADALEEMRRRRAQATAAAAAAPATEEDAAVAEFVKSTGPDLPAMAKASKKLAKYAAAAAAAGGGAASKDSQPEVRRCAIGPSF